LICIFSSEYIDLKNKCKIDILKYFPVMHENSYTFLPLLFGLL
jgi:hypothetical protein